MKVRCLSSYFERQSALRARHSQELLSAVPTVDVKRRHCLTIVAGEFGFDHWQHAVQVLTDARLGDFGKLLYPHRCGGYTHFWSASHAQARSVCLKNKGYLLAYQRQCFVVDEHYIAALGVDPSDPDWDLMGRDWIQPRYPVARRRLYDKVIAFAIDHFAQWGPLFTPPTLAARSNGAPDL